MHISFHYPEVGLSVFVNGVMSSNTLMSGIGCIINYELDLKLSGDPLIRLGLILSLMYKLGLKNI